MMVDLSFVGKTGACVRKLFPRLAVTSKDGQKEFFELLIKAIEREIALTDISIKSQALCLTLLRGGIDLEQLEERPAVIRKLEASLDSLKPALIEAREALRAVKELQAKTVHGGNG